MKSKSKGNKILYNIVCGKKKPAKRISNLSIYPTHELITLRAGHQFPCSEASIVSSELSIHTSGNCRTKPSFATIASWEGGTTQQIPLKIYKKQDI